MTKILVVEDEALVAEAVCDVLRYAGHHVVGVARDEASALRQAAAGHPDLVLMDIRLAGTSDGIETAEKMQAERPVSILFLSAHHDANTRARAAAVRPAGFIVKPFSFQQILDAVSAVAALRR